MTTIKNKVLTNIKTLMDLQNEKGLKKYGQSLDDCPSKKYDWKIMIIEELIDALQYQQKEMIRLQNYKSMSLDDYADKIEKWAINRNLHTAEPSKQMLKVTEELGELAEGLAKNDRDKIVDGIGDLFVTLIVLARQLEIDFRECVFVAYEEIKHRKGKMINGVFVKESDL